MTKILIIEDDENLGKSLTSFLEGEGHQVDLAPSLGQAREEELKDYDVIILDWMLPDGQGIDFLKEVRQQGNLTPIVIFFVIQISQPNEELIPRL